MAYNRPRIVKHDHHPASEKVMNVLYGNELYTTTPGVIRFESVHQFGGKFDEDLHRMDGNVNIDDHQTDENFTEVNPQEKNDSSENEKESSESEEEFQFYPPSLNKPYDSTLSYYRLMDPLSCDKILVKDKKKIVQFTDPWPRMFEQIRTQKGLNEAEWLRVPSPSALQAQLDQYTELNIMELRASYRRGMLSDAIAYFLKFCEKLAPIDFYNEENLENFKSMGGYHLLKDFLQVEYMEVQIQSLEVLIRLTNDEKYASFLHEISPSILQYVKAMCFTQTDDEKTLRRSLYATMLLKNLAQCDSVKKELEKEEHLMDILKWFKRCLNLIRQAKQPEKRNLGIYYAGVICQVLSHACELKRCRSIIIPENVTRKMKLFLENPTFQNATLYFYKNISTEESERLIILEQNVLSTVGHLLKHHLRIKDVLPCIGLVYNLMKSERFQDFVPDEDIRNIIKSLLNHMTKLNVWKDNVDLCHFLVEIVQMYFHKYIQESDSIHFIKEIDVVSNVMGNLDYEICKLSRHTDSCNLADPELGKRHLEIRIDILHKLVSYDEIIPEYPSLRPLIKMLRLKKEMFYPQTFMKTLQIVKKLGNGPKFQKDYYKELPLFWALYKGEQCDVEIRVEAALVIAHICSTWRLPRCKKDENTNVILESKSTLSDQSSDNCLENVSDTSNLRSDQCFDNRLESVSVTSLCPCISCVWTELAPLLTSRQHILEGVCCIMNAVSKKDILDQHLLNDNLEEDCNEDQTLKEIDNQHRMYLLNKVIREMVAYNFKLFTILAKTKEIRVKLLQQSTAFILSVSRYSQIAQLFTRENIMDRMILLFRHKDADDIVKIQLIQIINELCKEKTFLTSDALKERKSDLLKELSQLPRDLVYRDEIRNMFGDFPSKMLTIVPLISYEQEPVVASPEVIMKVFKVNRWVR